MDLFKDNQKRYEIKFLINSKEKRELIDKNQLKKLFPDRIVESVYFDTKDLQFFAPLNTHNLQMFALQFCKISLTVPDCCKLSLNLF